MALRVRARRSLDDDWYIVGIITRKVDQNHIANNLRPDLLERANPSLLSIRFDSFLDTNSAIWTLCNLQPAGWLADWPDQVMM